MTTMRLLIFLSLMLGLYHRANAQNYTCLSAGSFKYQDPTCRSYYLCGYYNGGYIKSDYRLHLSKLSCCTMRLVILLLLLGLYHQANAQNYTCSSAGRFRYKDPTCRSYYLCVFYNSGYIKSDYTCPSTMIFNPTTQQCMFGGTCIDNICDTVPGIPLFPKLPDPNGPDCRTYIQCMGIFNRYPVVGTCPDGLLFDKNLNPEPGCWLIGNCQ